MAAADIRLLRSAVLLQRFSLQELCSHAETNRNTASSWLKRNRTVLQALTQSGGPAERGRPRKIWSLRPEGIANLRQQLHALTLPDDLVNRAPAEAVHIDRVEELLGRWRAAKRIGDKETARTEHASARLRVRLAWEAFAEMEAARYEIPRRRLHTLAELERDLGLAALWDDTALPNVATWIAQRLLTMTERGTPIVFSARVLRLRTEVREIAQRARLTAAAFAAQVWADEELEPQSHLAPADLIACSAVLEDVSLQTRTEELLLAINPSSRMTYGTDAEQRQAILLGLASDQRHRPLRQVADWLIALRSTTVWSHELAPAVAYGAIGAPYVDARKVFEALGDSLRTLLDKPILARGHAGKLRSDAHVHSRDFVGRFSMLPSKTAPEEAQIRSVIAYFSRGHDVRI